MKQLSLFICSALLIASAATPCLNGQATTPAGRQQDLDYVANVLTAKYPNFFAYMEKGSWSAAVSALQARIKTTTDAEFYTGLGQLLALPKQFNLYLNFDAPFNYGSIALNPVWLDDGLFVGSGPPEYSQAIGARIIAVNGVPIEQVIQLIGSTFAYPNEQALHELAAQSLTSLFLLQGLDVIPAGQPRLSSRFRLWRVM
jgi:hypothetical protein